MVGGGPTADVRERHVRGGKFNGEIPFVGFQTFLNF
jgi:hypothetical protein